MTTPCTSSVSSSAAFCKHQHPSSPDSRTTLLHLHKIKFIITHSKHNYRAFKTTVYCICYYCTSERTGTLNSYIRNASMRGVSARLVSRSKRQFPIETLTRIWDSKSSNVQNRKIENLAVEVETSKFKSKWSLPQYSQRRDISFGVRESKP